MFIYKYIFIFVFYFILYYYYKASETEWRVSTKALKWKTALHVWGLERRPVWLKLSKTTEVGKNDRWWGRCSSGGRELLVLLCLWCELLDGIEQRNAMVWFKFLNDHSDYKNRSGETHRGGYYNILSEGRCGGLDFGSRSVEKGWDSG